jgi:AcrR family transcriptional regulator
MPTHKSKKPSVRTTLTRERVLQVALSMVDRGGLDALSMRKLAAKVGVEAMSLYHHVANKDDLHDGLVELVLREIELPSLELPWRRAMRVRASSTRAVFLAHPGAAPLMQSCVTMTPTRLVHADRIIGLLRAGGFTVTQAYRAFLTLDSYVYGFTMQELTWPRPDRAKGAADVTPPPPFPLDAFPNFGAVILQVMSEVGTKGLGEAYDAEFEFGLDLLLDGLARLLA